MEVKIEDHFDEVKELLYSRLEVGLETCGITAERYAKENLTANGSVDTGNLRNSVAHTVNDDEVIIGTAVEYGPYVEYGTGIHSTKGGRQTPWSYQDANGNWWHTRGSMPKPYLKPAAADHVTEYVKMLADSMAD